MNDYARTLIWIVAVLLLAIMLVGFQMGRLGMAKEREDKGQWAVFISFTFDSREECRIWSRVWARENGSAIGPECEWVPGWRE